MNDTSLNYALANNSDIIKVISGNSPLRLRTHFWSRFLSRLLSVRSRSSGIICSANLAKRISIWNKLHRTWCFNFVHIFALNNIFIAFVNPLHLFLIHPLVHCWTVGINIFAFTIQKIQNKSCGDCCVSVVEPMLNILPGDFLQTVITIQKGLNQVVSLQ